MAHDVFVSYSSKDKPAADAVCATLESRGIRCWIAPRDILPGADWGGSIVRAIAAARVFVLVFSAHANTSEQIKREVERAVNHGIPIIPVRIEDVLPTESLEYFINTPHWLDAFDPPFQQHLNYLADIVHHILAGEDVSPRATGMKRPPPRQRARFAWSAITLCLLLAAGGGLYLARGLIPGLAFRAHTGSSSPATRSSCEIPDSGVANGGIKLVSAHDAALGAKVAFLKKDYVRARTLFLCAADEGDDNAQYNLGVMYAQGLGTTQDYAEAARWFTKSAELDDPDAQNNLAVLYQRGAGVKQDDAQAARWFQRAAVQNNVESEVGLGLLYVYGRGVPQDYGKARYWFDKAASQGSATAEFDIGVLYLKGYGVEANETEAIRWIRKSAMAGHPPAEWTLGLAYANGEGVEKDPNEARKWIEKAAADGNANARLWLIQSQPQPPKE